MDGRAARAGLAGCCALMLLAAACTSSPAPKPGPTPPRPVLAWTHGELEPIGQFWTFGRVVAGYATEGRELRLVALDPTSGRQLWRQPASLGAIVPGVPAGVAEVDGRIAYLRPDRKGRLFARLVVADPATGDDVAVSPPLLFRSPPGPCTDGVDVCATSQEDYAGRALPHRMRVGTGAYVPDPGSRVPGGSRVLAQVDPADVLIEVGTEGVETLGLVRDGALRWRTPLRDAFPAGYSTDNGWSWDLFREQGVYAGTVFTADKVGRDGTRTTDLGATAASAGLSTVDGSVLWRDRGSWIRCSGSLEAATDADRRDATVLPVRCRYRGTATSRPDGSESFSGLAVTVEGFDPRTGRATWSVPVGAAPSLAGSETAPAIAGQTQFLILTDRDPVVLDVASGATHQPRDGESFWCRSVVLFDYREAYDPDGPNPFKRVGGELATPCDRHGRPAKQLPSAAATTTIGASAGRFTVVAGEAGVTGYRIK
jgi:hypothetical protein